MTCLHYFDQSFHAPSVARRGPASGPVSRDREHERDDSASGPDHSIVLQSTVRYAMQRNFDDRGHAPTSTGVERTDGYARLW